MQRVGIKYFHDFQLKIPRPEVEIISRKVQDITFKVLSQLLQERLEAIKEEVRLVPDYSD